MKIKLKINGKFKTNNNNSNNCNNNKNNNLIKYNLCFKIFLNNNLNNFNLIIYSSKEIKKFKSSQK